ncbi:cobalt ECF transporter T component CbiQ [Spirulina major]|uniref:cobalt ECF transporter T component CbiQ n=1 Tax=Spirulina major TaxID=270636 RepID=UPI000933DF2F|nr:cobalt ECF transporter T component CbiQ [Spirulina major]
MSFTIDRYAYLTSPLHRWEPRAKLVGLLALIFAFGTVQQLTVLPWMVLVTVGLYGLSRLPWAFGLNQLRYPGAFMVMVVILVPFAGGETVLWQWGALRLTAEGCWMVVRVGVRFFSIVTLSVVLFGTTPLTKTLRAMRSLGIPSLLVDMALLTYRYLQEFNNTRRTMQQAMRLRGFQGDRLSIRSLRHWAQLAGSLLVRSYDRATRVYVAMLLRGYGQQWQGKSLGWRGIDRRSWLAMGGMGAIAIAFVWFG